MKELSSTSPLRIRDLPYIRLSDKERKKLKPRIDTLREEALGLLSGESRVEFSIENSAAILLISIPEKDHQGDFYKKSPTSPGASVLLERILIDIAGKPIPNDYWALAIYPDGLALIRPNLELTPIEGVNMNREATEIDIERISAIMMDAVPDYNDYLL